MINGSDYKAAVWHNFARPDFRYLLCFHARILLLSAGNVSILGDILSALHSLGKTDGLKHFVFSPCSPRWRAIGILVYMAPLTTMTPVMIYQTASRKS